MFTIHADTLYFLAIFVVVAVAAIVGLWKYNADTESSAAQAIVLSDDVRADILRVRNKSVQEAVDARRAKMTEYRKSFRASSTTIKSDDTAETSEANRTQGLGDKDTTKAPQLGTPGPATS